jgi:NADP-dependent 3-hydroxy acid dehydrogenase YdfG
VPEVAQAAIDAGFAPVDSGHEGAMTERLDGTVALVTGASSGIGEATARELARRGATVAIAARRKDRLDALAQEIKQAGGSALALEADVTEREQVQRLVGEAVDRLGRLDIVVNNAGVMLLGPICDAPTEEWERMLDVNVKGVLYVADAALPHLLQAAEREPRRVADLVNISSVAGRVARRNSGVYNVTKHGVGAFSESLRQEVTSRHVRVSVVEPGAVATELASHIRDEIRDQMVDRFAGIEQLEAADIADAIAYIVTRPRRVAINELLIRPTEQEG